MSINISFHGGVDTVTGSCHLLQAGGLNILVDCGLFQGGTDIDEKNYDDFGFDPSSIDYLLVTHGHLDHCGRIPILVKKGFKGKIITTAATGEIAKVILLDSAKIQEEDFERWKRIKRRRGQIQREPLYTTLDAVDALVHFDPSARYETPIKLNGSVTATFMDAGHIFGSAFIEIKVKGFGTLIFSGDLGNRGKPILNDPSFPEKADVVIIESTYSNRNHKNIDDSVAEFRQAIIDTFKRGGNVLIPSFALERAQDLLYYLREFRQNAEIPACSVYLDSPMAINVADIMHRHPGLFDKEAAGLLQRGIDPFMFQGLKLTRFPEESRKINFIKSNAIIIAGSGMCNGGRISHHLKHNIWRKESSVVFAGYQAAGTLGRKIVDGNRRVKIFDEPFKVNAKIYTIGGFSAHADKDILLDWLRHCKGLDKLFLVHGERDIIEGFRKDLVKKKIAAKVNVPHLHQSFVIG
ncbi:MAG: MBL fold metallo-hydrolase [Nitrospirae bacterium]|nr:MBL fold metallo-hydrolase [Nitrospirota bacterium]